MKRYAVVCEGPSDFILIRKISILLADRNTTDIEIIPLSPALDQTSGSWPPHGWGEVKNWCKKHSENKDERTLRELPAQAAAMLRRQTWANLIRSGNLDGLIIHLDTDIATDIRDCNPSFLKSNVTRSAYCKRAIFKWLGIEGDPTGYPLHLLTPTYSSEKWILSTYPDEETIFSALKKPVVFEEIENPSELISQIEGYATINKNGKTKIIKDPSFYEKYSDRFIDNLDRMLDKNKEIADLNTRIYS